MKLERIMSLVSYPYAESLAACGHSFTLSDACGHLLTLTKCMDKRWDRVTGGLALYKALPKARLMKLVTTPVVLPDESLACVVTVVPAGTSFGVPGPA